MTSDSTSVTPSPAFQTDLVGNAVALGRAANANVEGVSKSPDRVLRRSLRTLNAKPSNWRDEMARYEVVDRSARFLRINLEAQRMAGSFEHALDEGWGEPWVLPVRY